MAVNAKLNDYAAARTTLLEELAAQLKADSRILAIWVTGSLGRGKGDAISDVDVTVVLTEDGAEELCIRPHQEGGLVSLERLELFSRFGRPAIVHENHNNAPPGGTFTFVQYAEKALIVDWTLAPQSEAKRPQDALLLFDKEGVPMAALVKPLETAERARIASEKAAFFWMMACVIVKYIAREDTLQFNSWLDELHWLVNDIEGLVAGKEPVFDPQKRLPLALTSNAQKEALLGVCRRMDTASSAIVELGGYISEKPLSAVQDRLNLI
jgi:hypothetical protein